MRCAAALREYNARSNSEKYGRYNFTQCDLPHLPSQRQCRDDSRQLNELRAARDSLQTEVNENVPVETSGLDDALRVCGSPIQSQTWNIMYRVA